MKDKMDVLQALALLSQVGIAIVVPVIGGVWLGGYLDNLLNTKVLFLVIGTLLGVTTGFRSAYRLIMQQQDDGK
ncbi:MAG: AtpZ/AtpI family protein [Bacillota bacterium]